MTALALDAHGDDLILFAAFTCLREKPHVIVVNPTVPRIEIDDAMDVLGLTWATAAALVEEHALVIAPAHENESHDEHNYAARLAGGFKSERRIDYLTYAPRGVRSTWGMEVVPSAKEIALKLRALSCFESQIEQRWGCGRWFFDLLDLREWVA